MVPTEIILVNDGRKCGMPISVKISVGEHTMTKRICILILIACLLNLSAADWSRADDEKVASARKCLSVRWVTNTRVVDDLNILFFTAGKTVYHNILPRQCKGLSSYGRFSYTPISGRLCNIDTIQTFGGRSCQLGYFHPINKEDARAIIEGPHRLPEPKPLPSAEVEDVTVESDEPPDSTLN